MPEDAAATMAGFVVAAAIMLFIIFLVYQRPIRRYVSRITR